MTKRPDPVFNSSAAQSVGIMVALLIIIPQLMRIADGRGNGFDVALLIAGILLAVAWLVIIVVGARRRLGSAQEPSSPKSEQTVSRSRTDRHPR